jgi:antitoxin YefM
MKEYTVSKLIYRIQVKHLDAILNLLYYFLYKEYYMQAISYSEARRNLKKYLDEVYHNHDPLIITRKNNENVVVISLEEYNSFVETEYLFSSENNAKRLLRSLEKARSGKGTKRELIE